MSMEPEPAIHGVDHSFTSRMELAKWRVLRQGTDIGRGLVIRHRGLRLTTDGAPPSGGAAQLQAIEPSTVAGATAVTDP